MTSELRKSYTKKILDKATSLDKDNQGYSKQIENYATGLTNEDEEDYSYRQNCLMLVRKFNNAVDELEILNGTNKVASESNKRAIAYLTEANIELKDYIPGFEQYGQALNIERTVKDLQGCWNILFKYVEDDDRSTKDSYNDPKYLEEPNESVLVDYDSYEVSGEKNDLHELDFSNVVSQVPRGQRATVKSIISAMKNINNYNLYGVDLLNDTSGGITVGSGGSYTITNQIMAHISGYTPDFTRDSYYMYNSDNEIDLVSITGMEIKTEVVNPEFNVTVSYLVVHYITNSGKKCSFKTSKEVDSKTINISDEYIDFSKNILEEYFEKLGNLIRSQGENFVNEGMNPDVNYPNFKVRVRNIKPESIDGIAKYINDRIILLNNFIRGNEFKNELYASLKPRMNKKDGTFTGWYLNVGSVDGSYLKLKNSYENSRGIFEKAAVWELEENPDGSNHIIIDKNPNKYYEIILKYSPNIKVGDTIYIVDNKNAETSTKIKNISIIEISGEADLDKDGNAITNKKKAYNVELYNQISNKYSIDENVRLIKELS